MKKLKEGISSGSEYGDEHTQTMMIHTAKQGYKGFPSLTRIRLCGNKQLDCC
jgi:hypothetical protein